MTHTAGVARWNMFSTIQFKGVFMNWQELAEFMQNELYLDEGQRRYVVDLEMSLIFHRPIMSVIRFDDIMHEKYGDYEDEGKCLKDILREHYPSLPLNRIMYYTGASKTLEAEND